MQLYLFLIFFTLTAKQIFAHAPVSTFEIEFLPVNEECHHRIAHFVVNHLIFIFLDSKSHLSLIEQFAAFFHLKSALIKVGLSVAIWPPQAWVIYHQLLEFFIAKHYLAR